MAGLAPTAWRVARVQTAAQEIAGRRSPAPESTPPHFDEYAGVIALDCGSGTGFISIALALHNLTVYALDLQEEMVYECIRKKEKIGLNNIKIIRSDIKYIPFSNHSFDLLFFTFVLHHIPDPVDVIKNSLQLIKKRGYLIIVDFFRHNNKKLADSMHDLWMGFQPKTFNKIAEKNYFTLNAEGEFKKKESLRY